MNRFFHFLPALLGGALILASSGAGATLTVTTATAPTGLAFTRLGTVKPRSAAEIKSSSWSIGGETLDRDFTKYENYKPFLGPLGAKAIRLQAGWAKTEKQAGVYSWEWLDPVVNDAVAQGVTPWLEFSYSNPIYPGVGDTGLGGGFPSTPEALAAWTKWVSAVVTRYGDKVHEWEVWNEPDLNNKGTATVTAYIDLFIRTASAIRELQPQSRIYALALAHRVEYADEFLAGMKERGKLDLIDAITIHSYPNNPDETSNIDHLRATIASTGRSIQMRQGETGAPSKIQENFALRNITWTENTQAKWDLRRMLAHHAKDVPFNLFTLSDMHYRRSDGSVQMNFKGLVGTNPDQTISHVKQAYYAAQNVFSIFDDTVQTIADFTFTSTSLRKVGLAGYHQQGGSGQVVAYWFNDAPPDEANGVTLVDVVLAKGKFTEPVLVDLRSGIVFSVPASSWSQDAKGASFKALPIYDSPLLIAERSVIAVRPDTR
ncbi:MAG: hypothetical protein ABIZ04_12740 [Opitutus sp.]